MVSWGLLVAALAATPPDPAPAQVRLCVLAFRDQQTTQAQWAPTAQHLSEVPESPPVTVVALDYPSLAARVRAGGCELVLTNPEDFVSLRASTGLRAVATLLPAFEGRPLDRFGGVVLVRDEPGAPTQLTQLRGRTIAAPARESLGGYAMQRWELQRAGLDVAEGDAVMRFLGPPHDRAVLEVAEGRADAAFVRTGVLEAMVAEGRLAPGALRVVEPRAAPGFPFAVSTELYPEWPLAASPALAPEFVRTIVAALFRIGPRDPEAVAGGYFGFAPPADYAPVEALMLRLHIHPDGQRPLDVQDVLTRYAPALVAVGLAVLGALTLLAVRLTRDAHRLRAAADERQHLLSSLAEGVVGLDLSGRVTFANAAARALTGFSEQELLGQRFHDLCHHHRADGTPLARVDCPFRHAATGGVPVTADTTFFRKDGAAVPVTCSTSPLNRDGALVGSVVTFIDITERHEYERRLSESRDEAEAASQAKSRFLAMMSHEIRTPLNGVLGMAQLMLTDGVDEVERAAAARTIFESGKTLLTILNDVLDLSSVEAGRLRVEREPVLPTVALADVHALFRDAAAARGLVFEARWDGPPGQAYSADPARLRQMCSNLVSNAIKFTESGSVRLVGRVDSAEGGRPVLRFEVQDTGPGVPVEAQAGLFQPFSQLQGAAFRHRSGTGLGLSIVRHLAVLLGGTAGCQSVPGQGSTFWFTITAEPVEAPRAAAEVRASQGKVARADGRPVKVLVVDDNPINRRVVQGLLSHAGCEVQVAAEGREAVDRVAAGAFDLVLMDCQMPLMDGFEATRLVRERERQAGAPRLPVVALTAAAFAEDRVACREAGMDGFLAKPVTLAGLLPVLRQIASGRAAGVARRAGVRRRRPGGVRARRARWFGPAASRPRPARAPPRRRPGQRRAPAGGAGPRRPPARPARSTRPREAGS